MQYIEEFEENFDLEEFKKDLDVGFNNYVTLNEFKCQLLNLITRCESAEKELKELREQKPIGIFSGQFKFENGQSYFTVKCFDSLPTVGAKLYESPVAQSQDSAEPVAYKYCGLFFNSIEECFQKLGKDAALKCQPLYTFPNPIEMVEAKQAVPAALEFTIVSHLAAENTLHEGYVNGWNDCRNSMLAAAPQPEGTAPEHKQLTDAEVFAIAPMLGNWSELEKAAYCGGFRRSIEHYQQSPASKAQSELVLKLEHVCEGLLNASNSAERRQDHYERAYLIEILQVIKEVIVEIAEEGK